MGESGANTGHDEARAMLDVFVSVGAARFDVTWTNAAGDKERFRRNVSPAELTRTLPELLGDAIRRQRNLIVRPHGPGVSFIQLDDLKADQFPPLAPAVFLTIETSPGNFQAWLALPGMEDKDFARRLRKGTGADTTASGATRVAGSVNFRDKYAPHFPRLRSIRRNPAAWLTPAISTGLAWSRRRRLSRSRCALPPPVFPPAATAAGRAMSGVWTVRR
jgi:hypothetical protein